MSDLAVTEETAPTRTIAPAPPLRTALTLLTALIASVGLTGWIDATQSISFTGYLRAQTSSVVAEHSAVLQKQLVETGSIIEASQPIATLNNDQRPERLARQQREIARLRMELARCKSQAAVDLAWRSKEIDDEILQTRLKSALLLKEQFAQQVRELAWQDFIKQYDAIADGSSDDVAVKSLIYSSGLPDETRIRAMLQHDDAQNAAEAHSAQLKLCEQRLTELGTLKAHLPSEIERAVGVEVVTAQIARAVEDLSRLETESKTIELMATGWGTVGVFRKQVGDHVSKGDVVVEVLDEDRRHLELQIPTRHIAEFAAGTEVVLLFPGGVKRHGRVHSVPPQTIHSPRKVAGESNVESLVTLRVDPIEKLWPSMPIGSAIEVKFAD
jgi:multidrug efflux pump subunit AcrA (membrane-fusion protein)